MRDVNKLIKSWIFSTKLGVDSSGYDKHSWAVDEVINMVADEPDEVWNIILGILGEDNSEIIVKAVGAGPLEDLMVLHGEEFIDRVESEASKCKTFKEAMKYTWLDSDDTKVCTRFFAIAGIEKPF